MLNYKNLPPQQLPFKKKTKEWRQAHLDWADKRMFFYNNGVRQNFLKKKVNYDLVNGRLNMQDLEIMINPTHTDASYNNIDKIQHYPIINSKLNVLRGEESKRRFDFRVIVTNPNAITEIENNKKEELIQKLNEMLQSTNTTEEEFTSELDKLAYYYTYEWQDMREVRANELLKHYIKELDILPKFNAGFMDAMICAEEIYQCDIISGEPVFERINPLKIHVFRSGYSNRIEDADIVVLIDYWSPAKIIDYFYDSLTDKDIKYIDSVQNYMYTDSMENIDERAGFINIGQLTDSNDVGAGLIDNYIAMTDNNTITNTNYYDANGNFRVLRVYWKSRRKIKKVKYFNQETGEQEEDFFPETYQINKALGEEEEILWINEAWEGTKIGKDIYLNMRPRKIQYNRLSNPSRCHFGIVGSIYNINDNKPFSLVDMMKPYNYLYDVIKDRLNQAIASNWGKIVSLDLSLVPKGWDVDKWLYFAKINKIAVTDSFKEGNAGAAMGKLAGMLNNNRGQVIDAETGNFIQQHINLLEFLKMEMSEVVGISKQREGQISSQETVGGVERATLQSSHITEYLFTIHDNVKKRALEMLLETAKIAAREKKEKFRYITTDGALKMLDIDGDVFAEADYGLMVDSTQESQRLNDKLEMLAQAALQNQALSFSSIMKLYSSASISEVQRIIEKDENDRQQQAAQQAQIESQQIEQQMQANMMMEQEKLQQEERKNIRDNETKILIAQLNAENKLVPENDGISEIDPSDKENLKEKIREFNEKMKLEKDKFEETKRTNLVKEKLDEKKIIASKQKAKQTK